MANTVEVLVPDIGEFTDIPVIEMLVSVGDTVAIEDSLLTLESDKATMDVPSPAAGVVAQLHVTLGDTVSEGSLLATIEVASDATVSGESAEGASPTSDQDSAEAPAPSQQPAAQAPEPATEPRTESPAEFPAAPASPAQPSGGFDDPIVTDPEAPRPPGVPDPRAPSNYNRTPRTPPTAKLPDLPGQRGGQFHATPSVRRFARELGVDLSQVSGTGRKGRVMRDDVTRFVKTTLTEAPQGGTTAAAGSGIPPVPEIDFSRFGEIEVKPLSRIKRISGTNLHRSWLNVPLVTHRDEADVTELEAFRKSLASEAKERGVRITVLAFIIKALVAATKKYPNFNASLSPDGESLIYKRFHHVGMAVDTPNGLVVPVLRDADKAQVFDLADQMSVLSEKARDGKLSIEDISGASITVSSLGGIGGTAFTPLVNAPEVAILGVARAKMSPVWDGEAFVPRLMLPLCLSYDHRVIDGAEGARFVAHLAELLGDVRRLLL